VLAPTQVVAHPTYAAYLARLLEEEGVDLPVERLFLWGEMGPSVPQVRDRMRDLWDGAEVRNLYTMEEVGILGAECQEGQVHCFEDQFLYEVMHPGSWAPLGPGERGELVITILNATALPLVRYRTGDLVVIEDDPCGCGRTHSRLQLLGRVCGTVSPKSIELTTIEGAVLEDDALEGRYRIVCGVGDPVLEVVAREGEDPERAALTLRSALWDMGVNIDCRAVSELPVFFHKGVRVIDESDLGLYHGLAEEQRRLEE
jgi:phenylacetate-CoA ligase